MALKQRSLLITALVVGVSGAILARWNPILSFLAGVSTTLLVILVGIFMSSRGADDTRRRVLESRLPASHFVSFVSPKLWKDETASWRERKSYRRSTIFPEAPLVSQGFDTLLKLALHDFVRIWYQKISVGDAFPHEVERGIRLAVFGITSRLTDVDLVKVGVTRLLPLVNKHLRSFGEAERLVRGKNLTRDITESEELDVAIAAKYEDGKLHPSASLAASKTTALQQQHLRRLMKRILPQILPENMTTSPSVLILVQEIVAGAVLLPLLQTFCDPDVLNQLVEAYGLSVLQERKTVRRLRDALDEHASPKSKTTSTAKLARLTPNDSERHFEKFIRSIRQCSSLSDARRFRSEVSRMLRKATTTSPQDPTYIRRLEVGKKLLDKQVEELSAQSGEKIGTFPSAEQALTQRENYSLRDVLQDAAGLSHFMEFMDRLNLTNLVQFWIVVDGFRGPLDYQQSMRNGTSEPSGQGRSWTDSDRHDLAQISDAYLWRRELNIPKESQEAVHSFLSAGSDATWSQYERARRAVLDAQEEVYNRMKEQHLPRFRTSDVYYTWLATDTGMLPDHSANHNTLSPADANPAGPSRKGNPLSAMTSVMSKRPDLRRVALSSTDLASENASTPSVGRRSLDDVGARKSLDEKRPRVSLFDDEPEDPLAKSTQSLSSDPGHGRDESERTETIAAVQAALDDLIDEQNDDAGSFLHSQADPATSRQVPSAKSEKDISELEKDRPSLASLGLLGTPSRRTVFSQGNLFGEEEEKSWQDANSDDELNDVMNEDAEIFEAAPGDLGLSELIQGLNVDIDKLEAQQTVVDSLTKKAELTNNAAELRILKKSKLSLEREIHRKELQRQQYMVQESDNTLFGKASISIKSIMVGTEEDGHEFALYVIEVQRQQSGSTLHGQENQSESDIVTWAITRRYSEFHDLHKRLRAKYPSVRELEFPKRQIVLTLQKDFLKKRRLALEKYLRDLLSRPDICKSLEFRAFLSQQTIRPINDSAKSKIDKQDFVTRIYNSVTDGVEEFLGNVPALDQLSVAGQNLISAASHDPLALVDNTSYLERSVSREAASTAEAQAEITAFESTRDHETTTFIKPVCDLFVELFQLHQGNNWLRGRAVVVVLQQLLGGTIERKVRESFKAFMAEESISKALEQLKDLMWPGGVFRGSPPPRSEAEKARSRREAGLVLATLLPDVAGSVVGRSNAAKAGRRIFATMNNQRLNQHLVYVILDEFVDIMFGRAGA